MSHEVFDTLAAVYAVGALDGDDLAQLERHLAQGCARCTAALRDSSEALAALALTATPVVPPAHVKTALLERLAEPASSRAPRLEPGRRPWLPWALAAAAVIAGAAFTGGFVAARYEGRLGQMARETSALKERVARMEAALREQRQSEQALRDQLAVSGATIDLLRDPATRVVDLRGLGPAPQAVGRVIWHEKSGGRIYVANLPPPPPGKAYELWTIAGAAPRPAGVFSVDAAGQGSHRVDPVEGPPVRVFAVTLEPEGGVPAPTGPMVLASK
jgi:anti-sigma-K factor RskA